MITKNRVNSKILVVDDESDAVELISFNLKNAGFEVISAVDGAEAIRKARTFGPHLVVLDVMLPEIDGLEVCKLMRRDPVTSNVPILMLTARATELDRVLGLELGADDYVTKPFSPRELVLRIKRLLRLRDEPVNKPERFEFRELTVDLPRHLASVNGRRIDLTATEFKLLALLMERRGRVQSREQLLRDVWNYDNMIDTRTVDTHVRRLREKMGRTAKYLDTVRGVGYRFTETV